MEFTTKTPSKEAADLLASLHSDQWRPRAFEILDAYRAACMPDISLSEQYNCSKAADIVEHQDFRVKDLAEKFISGVRFVLMKDHGKTSTQLECLNKWTQEWWKKITE